MEYLEKDIVLIGLDATIARQRVNAGEDKLANKAVDLIEVIRDYIAGQPAADVEPVVRCENCEHYIKSMMICKREGGLDTPDKTDFCSYGERIVTQE